MKRTSLKYLFLTVLAFLLFLAPPLCAKEVQELYIAQGMQKMSSGEMNEALEMFTKALEVSPGNIEASYYSGMANSRLGRFEQAESIFKGILEKNKDFIDAYLELGRIYYITSKCDEAENVLNKYVSMSDDAELSKYASDMLQACRAEEGEGEAQIDYYLNLSLGAQYDDNVTVEPTDPVTLTERRADYRALIYLTAGKHLFERGVVKARADYSFYLSRHLHLNDFDLNSQRLGTTAEFGISKTIMPSAGYSLVYTLIGGDLYSINHEFFAKVKLVENERASADIMYEYTKMKYWDSDLFETASIRDGSRHSFGIRQNYSGNFDAGLYFYYDSENTDTDYWDYDGFRLGGDISSEILPSLYGTLSAEYSEREYDSLSPSASEIRIDDMQNYSASLTYVINKDLSLQLSDAFTINNSNLDIYNYRRNILGLFLTAGIL